MSQTDLVLVRIVQPAVAFVQMRQLFLAPDPDLGERREFVNHPPRSHDVLQKLDTRVGIQPFPAQGIVRIHDQDAVVLEVPLLAEAPVYAELADEVLAIVAPMDVRVARAVDRGMDDLAGGPGTSRRAQADSQ